MLFQMSAMNRSGLANLKETLKISFLNFWGLQLLGQRCRWVKRHWWVKECIASSICLPPLLWYQAFSILYWEDFKKKKKIGSIFFLQKCKEKKRKEEKNILGLLTHWAWDTLKGNNSRIIQSFMKSPHIVGNKNLFGHWNLLPGVPLITEEGYQQWKLNRPQETWWVIEQYLKNVGL